ncbi:MAG: RAMP superfamily CRISPR-associated protein [Verrucomicrobiales bacterium]
MTPITRTFHFITPAFPHGAYQGQGHNVPELRGPTVRGQLRWWFAALFGQDRNGRPGAEETAIFGGVGGGPSASRFTVRPVPVTTASPDQREILPHKPNSNHRGPKAAFLPGTEFRVDLLSRREGLSEDPSAKLARALDAWLLLGGVGQRANRAAGSLWPENAPGTEADYAARCRELLNGSPIRFAVLDRDFGNDEGELRIVAGDILDGRAFGGCNTPFGSARPRKPSPLKLRAAWLDGSLRLVAVWDGRQQRSDDLRQGVAILAGDNKPLGHLLEPALPQLIG